MARQDGSIGRRARRQLTSVDGYTSAPATLADVASDALVLVVGVVAGGAAAAITASGQAPGTAGSTRRRAGSLRVYHRYQGSVRARKGSCDSKIVDRGRGR
jgi:hypothetical protein